MSCWTWYVWSHNNRIFFVTRKPYLKLTAIWIKWMNELIIIPNGVLWTTFSAKQSLFSYIYATMKVWRAFIHTKASSIFETAYSWLHSSFDSWEDSACVLAVTKSLKPCNVWISRFVLKYQRRQLCRKLFLKIGCATDLWFAKAWQSIFQFRTIIYFSSTIVY